MTSEFEETLWRVKVLNDDINLASYVTFMLIQELGITELDAEKLTLEIDELGSAVIFEGGEDVAIELTKTVHSYGLLAHMVKSG